MSLATAARIKLLCEEAIVLLVCVYALFFALIELYFTKKRLKSIDQTCDNQAVGQPKDSSSLGVTTTSKTCKISILIATRNESRSIGRTLRNLESTTANKANVEIIIVDVGSKDNTVDVAKASICAIPTTFIRKNDGEQVGRGSALNEAFLKATGDIIFIIRADSLVPPAWDDTLRKEFTDQSVLFASFKFAVDRKGLPAGQVLPGLWILEYYHNLRSNFLWFPSAIQGIAMTYGAFASRKFSTSVVMDDVDFCLRCRNDCIAKKLTFLLIDQTIECSTTRWEAIGVLSWIFIDSLANILFMNFGLSPECVYFLCYDLIPVVLRKFRMWIGTMTQPAQRK
jgi:glycosyltransferase involved in cell wall biosynthesis